VERKMQNKKRKVKGKIRHVKVWVKTIDSAYTGFISLPGERKRFSDIINDERKFISITDVESKDFAIPKPFLVINKDHIELMEVLESDKKE
jgi:hypothetical protein